jgi:hypothetical protein
MVVMCLWASGGMLSVGSHIFIHVRFPKFIEIVLGTFRSSGRFMLPVALMVIVFIVLVTFHNFKPKISATMLVFAFVITGVDQISNVRGIKAHQSIENKRSIDQQFIYDILTCEKINRVVFLVPEISGYDWKMTIIGQSSMLGIPVNDGFIARVNQDKLEQSIEESANEFLTNSLRKQTLYVLYPSFTRRFQSKVEEIEKYRKSYSLRDARIIVG